MWYFYALKYTKKKTKEQFIHIAYAGTVTYTPANQYVYLSNVGLSHLNKKKIQNE